MGMDCSALFDRARRAWPTVVLDVDVWCRHLEALGWGDESPMFPEHLYLACACAHGSAEALRIVDSQFVASLYEAAQRKLRDSDRVAEVLQRTRERLFTGSELKIGTYRGSGHLRAWLLMVMSRIIATMERAENSKRQHERVLIELWEDIADDSNQRPPLHPDSVDLVERCLFRVFAALPARDRAVMKLYYLEGLSIDAIGLMYQRHRSQIARWLGSCRERIRDELRQRVRNEVGAIGESELGSLLRMVQNEMDVTISTLLASTHDVAAPPTTDFRADSLRREGPPLEPRADEPPSQR